MELHLFPVNKPNSWSCYITTIQREFCVNAAVQAQSRKGDDFSHMRLQLCCSSSTQSSSEALEPPTLTRVGESCNLHVKVLFREALWQHEERCSHCTLQVADKGSLQPAVLILGQDLHLQKQSHLEWRLQESAAEAGARNVIYFSCWIE